MQESAELTAYSSGKIFSSKRSKEPVTNDLSAGCGQLQSIFMNCAQEELGLWVIC